ncbi:MAG: DoxX family protein [Elusimicrobia bacterium]|nr:DoxX family protein [Elusimicrobiota bacterium]
MDKDDLFALTGRVFIATIFLASAFGKITNFQATTQYMEAHGMPLATALGACAIALEVLGGLSLVLGFHARWGAVALLLFMVPATLIFHLSPDQRIQFLKNLAIMGGLLHVAAFGPGEISLDNRR